jgi:hypothetical protein
LIWDLNVRVLLAGGQAGVPMSIVDRHMAEAAKERTETQRADELRRWAYHEAPAEAERTQP